MRIRLVIVLVLVIGGLLPAGSALADPPTTSIDGGPADAAVINQTDPVFTVSASDPLAAFTCTFDGVPDLVPCGPTTVHFPTAPLADGPHTFEVHADGGLLGGGLDPVGASRSFTVDTQLPSLTIDSGPSGATNVASPSFGFTAEALAAVACRIDADPFGACTTGATFDAGTLAEGSHTFEVRATDAASNVTTTSRSFNVDLTDPTAEVTGGPTDLTGNARPSFTFTTGDAGAEASGVTLVECRFDSASFAACTSPLTPGADLSDGAHQFDVRATDAAGNVSAVGSRAFSVNSAAPAVQITAGPSGDTAQKTPTFTFTTGPGNGADITAVECRFDSAAFAPCDQATMHSAPTALSDGAHTFQVRATNALALTTMATRSFTEHTGAPTASFTTSPSGALTGQLVAFTATSTDADGTITLNEWDLDNDGTFEATGATASRSFRVTGHYTVRLRSTDQWGVSSTVLQAVDIGNRPPAASFVVSPETVAPGAAVTFIATSTDADGPTPAAAWDLGGGDGFSDAAGTTATRTFSQPGTYTVRLRATDADGATDVATRTVVVAAATAPPPTRPSFLSPAPVVRIAGVLTSKGVNVRLLSVTAPQGARVEIRCRGRSCPLPRFTRTQRSATSYRLFARPLRAGVVLEIRITLPNTVGRYTRFLIRRGAAPLRLDRCLDPGTTTPVRCAS